VKLPSQAQAVERAEVIRGHLESFATARADDPLVWCSMPRLGSLAYFHMASPHQVPSALSRSDLRLVAERRWPMRGRRSPRKPGVLCGQGTLFMATDANMCRSQSALHERFGPVRPPAPEVRASYRRTRKLVRGATAVAGELVACARREQLELPVDSRAIGTRLVRAAGLIAYAEALLERERPRVVVTGSILSPRGRALVHAARRAGVPSVYIPHTAQSSVDVRLIALPVDYAGLRGSEEVRYLVDHGVQRERLDVVGNPTIAPGPAPAIDPRLGPVFATGLEDFRLEPLLAVVRQALPAEVTVARHPSERSQPADPFAAPWRIFPGRTYDLLASGPPVVVQHSSGVALEALHLGIPVVELRYPGKSPLYPLIREPYVRFASSASELQASVAQARADAADQHLRRELIAWAQAWSGPNGREAGERAVALVERARVEGQRRPIWNPLTRGPERAVS
jgi:hypothetical protein